MNTPELPEERKLSTIYSLLNQDLNPECVKIECSSQMQIPHLQILGLPGPEVSEARDRVRSAFINSGYEWPQKKLILNLSPVQVRKQGSGHDLGIAMAILQEAILGPAFIKKFQFESIFAWAELGLHGDIRSAGQTTRALVAAYNNGIPWILLSKSDREHTRTLLLKYESVFKGRNFKFIFISHLNEILRLAELPTETLRDILKAGALKTRRTVVNESVRATSPLLLPEGEKILKIALSGHHHFLLLGAKGTGKTQTLKALNHIWPASSKHALYQEIVRELATPFASSQSAVQWLNPRSKPESLLGSLQSGGFIPGAFALAHGGAIVADEFPEWPRDTREALRDPLESQRYVLQRARGQIEVECDFLFCASGNLCPCGGTIRPPENRYERPCRCLAQDREKYIQRLSGPILDRIDMLIIWEPRFSTTESIPARLTQTIQETQRNLVQTWGQLPGKFSVSQIENVLITHPNLRKELQVLKFESLRDRHKTLKLALTIAMLEGRKIPQTQDLAAALEFRRSPHSFAF